MYRNQANQTIGFQLNDFNSGSGIVDAAASPVLWYILDGGTAQSGEGAFTHKKLGSWSYALPQIETSGEHLQYFVEASGAIGQTVNVFAEPPVNMNRIDDNIEAARNLKLSTLNIIPGTVESINFTPSTTGFRAADITEETADHFNGRILLWTDGSLSGQVTDVLDYVNYNTTGEFVVTALTEAPASGDSFILV